MKTALAILAVLGIGADAQTICDNAEGVGPGGFYTFWHDAGFGCMTLGRDGGYGVRWQLGTHGNLVAGRGWAKGSNDRVVRYEVQDFVPGTNGYLTLYGWSTDPLVEYYVVENWGDFVPPGPLATRLGVFASDGGTYRVYRTRRVDQPSIRGNATFYQYWSVRTERRPIRARQTITFANHVAAWRRSGLRLGTLGYQVLATEGFGSSGRSDIRISGR